MKTGISIITLLFVSALCFGQGEADKENGSGQFSLGMRTTVSAFGNSGYSGFGYGGHFRIRLGDRLSTEWYADYITTDIGGLGNRLDGHIGWSVMFYPLNKLIKKGAISPYFLAGHCFDYTKVESYSSYFLNSHGHFNVAADERWSSAVHLGIGSSYNLTDNFDFSVSAQYMSHLGNEVHAEIKTSCGQETCREYLDIDDHHSGGLSLEGHLLISCSINLMIGQLWK